MVNTTPWRLLRQDGDKCDDISTKYGWAAGVIGWGLQGEEGPPTDFHSLSGPRIQIWGFTHGCLLVH